MPLFPLTAHELLRKLNQLFPMLNDERDRAQALTSLAREAYGLDELARMVMVIRAEMSRSVGPGVIREPFSESNIQILTSSNV